MVQICCYLIVFILACSVLVVANLGSLFLYVSMAVTTVAFFLVVAYVTTKSFMVRNKDRDRDLELQLRNAKRGAKKLNCSRPIRITFIFILLVLTNCIVLLVGRLSKTLDSLSVSRL